MNVGYDKSSLDHLFQLTYEELRRLAYAVQDGNPRRTLNPTALVNEAYLKLVQTNKIQPESALHFKRIVAVAMRQVLIDAARRHTSLKRGAGFDFVTVIDDLDGKTANIEELLTLDTALKELEELHPRQARLVEYRFFGGFNLTETTEMLNISESTALRDWRMAKAWLTVRLRGKE
jgi:RNA polymerase sigma factor (TIGR02999 family)